MPSAPELVASLKTCLKAFNIVSVQQNQDYHLRQLILELHIERCRLYIWGFILSSNLHPEGNEFVSIGINKDAIKEKLGSLLDLFTNLERLQQIYGFKQYLDTSNYGNEPTNEVRALTVAFDYFSIKGQWNRKIAKLYKRSSWTIQNRTKFSTFIYDVRELIDALQDETKDYHSVATQDEMFLDRVLRITSADTLNAISEASHGTYLHVATATANKAESLRTVSATRLRIEHWLSYEDDNESHESLDVEENDNLSSASITEHSSQSILESRVTSQNTSDAISQTTPDTSTPCEFNAASEDTFIDHRAAKPLVIPMQIRANAPSALGPIDSFDMTGDWRQDESTALGSSRSTVVSADLADEEPKHARSESSTTVITETKDKGHFAKSDCLGSKSTEPQQRSHLPNPVDESHSITNGFMHFASLNDETQKLNDYFVMDFRAAKRDLIYSLAKCLGHSHYVEIRQVARVVRSSSYVPFDLRSWPREIHISELVDRDSMDQGWVNALRLFNFQANIFASPRLRLPFCSGPDGGCLRQLFDMLVDGENFARFTPTIAYSFERAPEVFVVPVGKSIPLPQFITFCSPTFKPQFDMLLILLVFSHGSIKSKVGKCK